MSKTFIGVTTYKKPDSLDVFVRGLLENNYLDSNTLCIADDNSAKGISKEDPRSVLDVFEKYKNDIPDLRLVYGDSRGGVSLNKNRTIKNCLDSIKKGEHYDNFVVFDDDVEPFKHGLLEEFEVASINDKQGHINGYWTRDSLLQAFNARAESDYCYWTHGCQGVCLWFKIDLLRSIGFFPKYIHMYGYDHISPTARSLMYQGFSPDLYPTLKRFGKYIRPQNIPNRYEIDPAKLHGNSPEFWSDMARIRQGLDLQISDPRLPKKGEQLVSNKKK